MLLYSRCVCKSNPERCELAKTWDARGFWAAPKHWNGDLHLCCIMHNSFYVNLQPWQKTFRKFRCTFLHREQVFIETLVLILNRMPKGQDTNGQVNNRTHVSLRELGTPFMSTWSRFRSLGVLFLHPEQVFIETLDLYRMPY